METQQHTGEAHALTSLSPEVIVISSDDEDDDDVEAVGKEQEVIPWVEAIPRLLALAEDREQLDDPHELPALLREMRVNPSIDVRCALRSACEALGQLVLLSGDRVRRRRASSALVLVLCEVLSLAQVAPPHVELPRIKKEDSNLTASKAGRSARDVLDLVTEWNHVLSKILATHVGKQSAFSNTLARLDALILQCLREHGSIGEQMAMHAEGKESAALKWVETVAQDQQELSEDARERSFLLFDRAFIANEAVRTDFLNHHQAHIALVRQERRLAARRAFYEATVLLTHAVAAQQDQDQGQTESEQCGGDESGERALEMQMNLLGNGMLHCLEDFCSALRGLMMPASRQHGKECSSTKRSTEKAAKAETNASPAARESERRAALVAFAKQLELFWLLNRNRLPPAVLDVVAASFESLSKAHGRSGCPVSDALARIYAGLRAGSSSPR
ncbi:hypothetical protein BBJ28_00001393 [Nothophytophthora sp. Chile5]|nr:hypothetical protein BBJ28_00001393 [Nothophytophthora sp. Chile5]